ncbi:MAG: cadherin domain-containing protein, partial [Candidatus Gracilibacteria bacterium]|nr:cadherin domain-containing protein [Candidatus Gracilibacteria bacterium]
MKNIFIKFLLLSILIVSFGTTVNAATPVITNATGSVDENSANLFSVLTHTGSDSDLDIITYDIISGNTGSVFSIDVNSAEITVSGSLDYESLNQYLLTVQATASGETDTATITIDITDINEAPILTNATGSVNENSANGTIVLAHTGSDVDSGTTLIYSILSGNIDGAFAINSSTSEITVSGSIDYDTTTSYNLVVEVSDSILTNTGTITINVIEDTTAPVFSSLTTTSNNSKNTSYAKAGDDIAILLTINPEDTWKQLYNKALFSIGTSTGETNKFSKSENPKSFATRTVNINSGENGDFLITGVVFQDWEGNDLTGFVAPASNIIVDTTAPVINFSDDVIAGPVQSDTLNIIVTDLNTDISSYEYAFTDDATCTGSVTFTETFTSGVDIILNDESHNDKYVCIKAEDAAGNISYLISSEKINIDITVPTILNSNIISNNINSGSWAKVGDEITLTVEFSEEVNSPELMILNNTGSVVITQSGSSNIYVGKYITTSSDIEGEINYSINTTDIALNNLVEVSATTDSSKVIFDRTSPIVTVTGADPETVEVSVGSSYTELGSSTTDNSGESLTAVVTGTVYTTTVGSYTLRYTATDSSTNVGTTTRTVKVVDTTSPIFDSFTLSSNNSKNTSYAKEGDNIIITLNLSPEDSWKSGNNGDFSIGATTGLNTGDFTTSSTQILSRNKTYPILVNQNGVFSFTNLTFLDAYDHSITGFTAPYFPTSNIIVDTIAPSIIFVDNVITGPVQSDTINITVSDINPDTASYEYGFSSDSTCDNTDTYGNTFTSGINFVINTETNNGKYICIKAEDAAGNISYLVSSEKINIDITVPTILNSNIISNNINSGSWAK